MTASTLIAILQWASSLALVAIAALAIRDWFATRTRAGLYLLLAIGSLAAVSVLGQIGRLLGPGFAGASAPLTVILFLGSGLALTFFRDSLLPLRRWARSLVIAGVAAAAFFEIVIQVIVGKSAARPLQAAALLTFVAVWVGCVAEPSIRLWLAARGRTPVQRARMRALSYAYLAIVVILLAAVLTASLASEPAVQIAFALSGLAIMPLLYAGFVPPAWLRRAWRQAEESRLQDAINDLLVFAPDQATMASRGLDWAVRLMGADGGFVVGADGALLAVKDVTTEEASALAQRLGAIKDAQAVSLGGNPPRNAVLVPLAGSDARIVLVGGPFTPVFGSDDLSWIRQYAALVRTGMDRVKLVEAVERSNAALEEKVAEETERTHQLEAANRELEAFSYTISHDLRAPLRAINGFTSILLEEHLDALPEEARGYLRRVHDNGQHMGRLVDDLLAFSRLGRQALRKQTVDMQGVVERALAQLGPQLENRHIDLAVGELPGCEADPALLEQVFVNLLSNAIKYSQKREKPRIEVGVLEKSADSPTYFVRDNGAGFDMAYADKLFGVFQRLHRSQDYEGTGVGLAIVHRIIDRHGGRVWAEAAVDRGATFYFSLKGVQQWQLPKAA